jgi:hypothetical protein
MKLKLIFVVCGLIILNLAERAMLNIPESISKMKVNEIYQM